MTSLLRTPVNARDHVAGSASAPITLVEYGDYECPYCGQAYRVVKALQEQLGAQLLYVFRNFPLASSHPHALLAAEAAEAAAVQGKFWAMHDLLYEHQDALEPPDLFEYAARLGLELDGFERDLRSPISFDKIGADLRSGAISGVNGTPTFFVNGYRHDGDFDHDSLWNAIIGATGHGATLP
jgi:protein-disulfide isomerase